MYYMSLLPTGPFSYARIISDTPCGDGDRDCDDGDGVCACTDDWYGCDERFERFEFAMLQSPRFTLELLCPPPPPPCADCCCYNHRIRDGRNVAKLWFFSKSVTQQRRGISFLKFVDRNFSEHPGNGQKLMGNFPLNSSQLRNQHPVANIGNKNI